MCFMDGICMVPCMHANMIIGGRTNHFCCVSSGDSNAYLSILRVVTTPRNLSSEYVRNRISTLKLGAGSEWGGGWRLLMPLMYIGCLVLVWRGKCMGGAI